MIARASCSLSMGAERKGPPLPIDIGQVMKYAVGESYNLEITGRKSEPCVFDRSFELGEENEIASWTDYTLKEKIQAYQCHLKVIGGRTKDKGEKIKRKLACLNEELEKRQQRNVTGNQENDHEKSKGSAFSDDLEIFKGTCNNFNPKNGLAGKNYKLLGDMTCRVQKCSSSNTVSTISFYTSSGELSHTSKEHLKNNRPSNEAENSIASRVTSGKRNRSTSPLMYKGKDAKSSIGLSPPDYIRRPRKTTMAESISSQKSRSLPGMHRHKDSIGASLDTAMELSDDEERRGLQDVNDVQHGKDLLAHQYTLRSNSGRKEGSRVTYPGGDPEAVEVQQSDLKHLDAYEFLNDTVIDFYIKYLQRPEAFSNEKKADFHFFNTFFFKKLLLEKRKRKKGDTYYYKLRKWTKGINIFEKKHLLVPVHDCAHWSLAIICFAMDHREKEVLTPYILHLDSMKEGHASEEVFHVLKSYLEAEWNHVRGLDGVTDSCSIVLKDIICKRIEVPLQQNAWDCGLFLLYFIECFLRDASKFDPESLDSMFGRQWFRPQDASNLRPLIKGILQSLIEPVIDEIMMEDMD